MYLIFARSVMVGVGIVAALYWFPYLIKKGWEDGKNASLKTSSVCDVCFRNIKKWNEELKKRGVIKK